MSMGPRPLRHKEGCPPPHDGCMCNCHVIPGTKHIAPCCGLSSMDVVPTRTPLMRMDVPTLTALMRERFPLGTVHVLTREDRAHPAHYCKFDHFTDPLVDGYTRPKGANPRGRFTRAFTTILAHLVDEVVGEHIVRLDVLPPWWVAEGEVVGAIIGTHRAKDLDAAFSRLEDVRAWLAEAATYVESSIDGATPTPKGEVHPVVFPGDEDDW